MPASLPAASIEHDGPGAPCRHGCARRTPARTVLVAGGHAALRQRPHVIVDLAQPPPQVAGRMKAGKILAAKHRMRLVTSARASPTASMAVVLVLGARPSEQASCSGPRSIVTVAARASVLVGPAGDRPRSARRSSERGKQPDDFLGFAALREDQHHVVVMDASQVAVDRFGRMQEMAAACRSRPAWRRSSGRSARPCPCR